jgi:lysophospholipid acyltransferase (LPLAT)-like uncharacterized protein
MQLLRAVRERPVAFALDGPRGPARVAQPGAVWLSQRTGNPIIPFHLEANRFWSLNSWDQTQIPKPFATIALAFAAPLSVGAGGEAALADANRELQERLNAAEEQAHSLLAVPSAARLD